MDVQKRAELHNQIAALHAASPFLHPGYRRRRNFFEVNVHTSNVAVLRSRLVDKLISFQEATDYFNFGGDNTDDGEGEDEASEEPPSKRSLVERVVRNPSSTPFLTFPHPGHFFPYEDWPI